MHLADADTVRDLALGVILEVAEIDDLALALGQALQQSPHAMEVLDRADAGVGGTHAIDEVPRVRLRCPRPVQGQWSVQGPGLGRLEHLVNAHARRLRELGRGRGPAEPLREHADQRVEVQVELLEPARDAQRPAPVPEMTAQLAPDRRHRERAERRTPLRLEALDRLEQPEQRHLGEVLERLTATCEPADQRPREPRVLLDQPVPQLARPGAPVLAEQLVRARRAAAARHGVGRAVGGASAAEIARAPIAAHGRCAASFTSTSCTVSSSAANS